MRALIAAAMVAATATPAMADTFSTYQLGGTTYTNGRIGGFGGRSVEASSYQLGGTTYTNVRTGGFGGRSYSCSSTMLGGTTYTNCH